MKQFLLNLLNGSDISSKRFGALITLASVLALAFIATFKNNGVCPEYIYNGLLLLIGGLFGFGAAENIFKKKDAPQQSN